MGCIFAIQIRYQKAFYLPFKKKNLKEYLGLQECPAESLQNSQLLFRD